MSKTQTIHKKPFVKSGLSTGSFFNPPSDSIKVTDEEQIAKRSGFFLIAKTQKINWNETLIPADQLKFLEVKF